MQVSHTIALGGEAEYNPGFLIYGISADNDTGNWYRIYAGSPVPHILPPYVYGWQQEVNGAQVIKFVLYAGPPIIPSQNVGSGINLMLDGNRLQTRIGYNGLSASASFFGSFQQQVKTTVMTINPGAAVPVPTVSMAGRLAMMLQAAPENSRPIYIGGINVTADETATGGVQLNAGQSCPVDASDGALLYATVPASSSGILIVAEAK